MARRKVELTEEQKQKNAAILGRLEEERRRLVEETRALQEQTRRKPGRRRKKQSPVKEQPAEQVSIQE